MAFATTEKDPAFVRQMAALAKVLLRTSAKKMPPVAARHAAEAIQRWEDSGWSEDEGAFQRAQWQFREAYSSGEDGTLTVDEDDDEAGKALARRRSSACSPTSRMLDFCPGM